MKILSLCAKKLCATFVLKLCAMRYAPCALIGTLRGIFIIARSARLRCARLYAAVGSKAPTAPINTKSSPQAIPLID
jgi:hypothetical protein